MNRPPIALAVLAIVLQIGYPLTSGGTRDALSIAIVAALAATVLVDAAMANGWRFAAVFGVLTIGGGFAIEAIGTATCVPFGCYHYSDQLGPRVLGVPLTVALAWAAGTYPIWVCASAGLRTSIAACHDAKPALILRVLVTAITLVGWDLYLDPQMVADGRWTWHDPSPSLPGLPQIPIANFLGWFLVGVSVAVLLAALPQTRQPSPTPVAVVLLLWTWLGSALAHAVFLNEPGLKCSALYGFVGMSLVGVPVVGRIANSWHDQRRA